MRDFDALVERVAAEPMAESSLRVLLQELAAMLEDLHCHEASDIAYALRAKAEDIVYAIVRKPRPDVIPLPDRSGED
jgi:hypothetical protein